MNNKPWPSLICSFLWCRWVLLDVCKNRDLNWVSVGLRMCFGWINLMSERIWENDVQFIERLEKSKEGGNRGSELEGDLSLSFILLFINAFESKSSFPQRRGILVGSSVWRVVIVSIMALSFDSIVWSSLVRSLLQDVRDSNDSYSVKLSASLQFRGLEISCGFYFFWQ
jgi:hypothetical protein